MTHTERQELPLTEAAQSLRRRAEDRLPHRDRREPFESTPEEVGRLVEELQIHQVELEMQNESLRHIQQELECSRTRYFDLYELAPIGYVTLSEASLIEETNLAAAQLLGTVRGLLLGKPLTRFILADDQDVLYRTRLQLLTTGTRQTCELRLQPVYGPPIWAALTLTLSMDQESKKRQMRVTLSDISARKQAETILHEEAQRKDHFLALLGHELRNPLASILHATESLRLGAASKPTHIDRMTEILTRQVGHLTRLVDDLLDVARIGRGTIPLEKRHFDLRESVASAVEQARPLLDAQRQPLTLALPDAPVMLNGDAVRLAQVIVNLLRNASQCSPPETPIALTLAVENECALLTVTDQGIGLDPLRLPHIFESVVQDTLCVARTDGGLGMGLTLVKGLVELHDGWVEANSLGRGQGSRFCIHLPLSPAPSTAVTPPRPPCRPPTHRILVVDDNADVAEAFALLLDLLGQQVETAPDGPAALAALERWRPDVILLDIGLPGMDGFEVARRLRATDIGGAAWLVAITGHGQERDLERARASGFNEHLLKPLSESAVISMLERCPAAKQAITSLSRAG